MEKRLFILLLFINFFASSEAQERFTVVIDPGHGGFDPGTSNKNIEEKDLVLNYVFEIGKIINQSDPSIQVIYTRTKDNFIPLHERAAIANKNHARLFVSIHANSYPKAYVRGLETFIVGMHDSDDNFNIAKKENAVILNEDNYKAYYEDFDPNSSESYIIFDMVQEEHLMESADFSILVQNNITKYTSRKNRGIKQAGFLVLKEVNMPGVLIELGYLTNIEELNYLLSNKGKENIAQAIAQAIIEYKNKYTK
ncbi:MAG: N-acetylmuramoyl-L-alanine amidase [Mangrovibacterium sp.]